MKEGGADNKRTQIFALSFICHPDCLYIYSEDFISH